MTISATERVFGHKPTALAGRELSVLQPERLREAHRQGMRRFLATGERRVDWRVKVKKGEPVHMVVTRKTDQTCATEIVIKDLGIKKELPLNKAVAIDFTPKKTGEINYVCGMDMLGGKLVVQ